MNTLEHATHPDPHPDNAAVDRFADRMKLKLARARRQGRGGWDDPATCTPEQLAKMLIRHIWKGDPVDIANLAMMLSERGVHGNGSVISRTFTAQLDALSKAGALPAEDRIEAAYGAARDGVEV